MAIALIARIQGVVRVDELALLALNLALDQLILVRRPSMRRNE